MPSNRELIRASLDSGADEPGVEAREAMLRVLHGARLSHTVPTLPRAAADSPAATIPAKPFPLNAETAPAPITGCDVVAQGFIVYNSPETQRRLNEILNAPPSPAVATSDM